MPTKEELLKQLEDLKKMREEVAAMPDEEETQPTTVLKQEPTDIEKAVKEGMTAAGRGALYGAFLGAAPAIEAAATTVGDLFKGKVAPAGSPEFKQRVLESARPYVEAKKQYPVQYGVGEFAGTLGTSLLGSAGAAKLGGAAAGLVSEASPVARGLTKAGVEALGEAGIGAATAAAQGQDKTEGALLGAAGSLGGQLIQKGAKAVGDLTKIPSRMKERAIKSAPEALRPAAAEMAESPKAFEQYQTAEYKLKKPGGLQEQLKTKQTAEEAKFNQLQQDIETTNKQKTADYQAALSEEDKAQKELLEQSIAAVKRSRTEDAANKLSQTIDRGLKIQNQKAAAKYEIAYNKMLDQVDPAKSQINVMSNRFNQMDQLTRGTAPETAEVLADTSRLLQADTATGAHTTGKELKYLVKVDQSLSADIRNLRANLKKLQQSGQSSPNMQEALARLNGIKQEFNSAIQSGELGIPKEAIDQYNQAKAHYAEFSKLRDDLLESRLLAEIKVKGAKVIKPTAERAAKILAPEIEDYAKTADVMQTVGRLPSEVEGVPAMSPEQFMQLKQQATTMPAGLLPERTRPAMPTPQLQEVPTQRVISPEEAALQGQVDVQRGKAAAFEELARPGDVSRSDRVPGKIGLVQKAVGATPAAKISRAQTVERMFQNPGLSFAVRVLEGQRKAFTLPMVQMLARQYQVDPMELQKALAEQQSP